MKTWIFTGILPALCVIALCSAASSQCTGGTCQRPVQATKSVLVAPARTVQSVAAKQPVRKVLKFRLFRRGR